jgi:hypothetical protein
MVVVQFEELAAWAKKFPEEFYENIREHIQAQGMAVARYAEELDIAWWRITLATWFMSASRLDCWKN